MNYNSNILHIIDTLNTGGAERVCIDQVNLLASKKIIVGLLVVSKTGPLVEQLSPSVNFFNLKRSGRFKLKYWFRLRKIISEYDVIHIHMRHTLLYIFLIKLCLRLKVKVVFQDHYGKIKDDKSFSLLLKWAILKVDRYIGVSDELCQWAVKVIKLNENKVDLLPNIVIKREVDQGFTIDDKLRLVCVCNIHRIKNIEYVIKLVDELIRKTRSKCSVTIYGNVHDEAYYEYLLSEIGRLGLESNITFVHNCTDIQKELYKYDLALHAAKSETGPLVLLEYVAQGVPFLTYNTGEVIKQVSRYYPDFCMDSFETTAWIDKIFQILPFNRKQLSSTFIELSDENAYTSDLINIYL